MRSESQNVAVQALSKKEEKRKKRYSRDSSIRDHASSSLVVMQKLNDIRFRWLRYHPETVAEGIFVGPKTIVGWNVSFHFYANLANISRSFHGREVIQTVFLPLMRYKKHLFT